MIVTEFIEFNRKTLDTSIENFIELNNLAQKDGLNRSLIKENIIYLIVMKHLINYLKNHPESQLCRYLDTQYLLRRILIICESTHLRTNPTPEFTKFVTNKTQQLDLDRYCKLRVKMDILEVWFLVDQAIENLEHEYNRMT